jgi:NADH-quinone oxidoreductase subunit C/D
MSEVQPIVSLLESKFGNKGMLAEQVTADGMPTFWVGSNHLREILRYLKNNEEEPYKMLYDLTAADERKRTRRDGLPAADFTIIYHLTSIIANKDIRLKVPLTGEYPSVPSITGIWPSANWYEREVFDMFGIRFEGHPDLRRILMPRSWKMMT